MLIMYGYWMFMGVGDIPTHTKHDGLPNLLYP